MEKNKRKDPLTDELFVPKMINQRFASRKNQIEYNNLVAKQKRLEKSIYDKPLDRNRNVLKKVLASKEEVIKSKDFLLALEYNFTLSMYQVMIDKEKKITAKGIYEYLIIALENNYYKITTYERVFGNK